MPIHRSYAAIEYRKAYAILSGLFAALSFISLVTRYLSVGLAPIALEFVAFYRQAISFVLDPLLSDRVDP